MKRIFAIVDYKGQFGSKWFSNPYRGGMDVKLLQESFNSYGYQIEFVRGFEIRPELFRNELVIYTSQEDSGSLYKGYIEDIILALEIAGADTIPQYKFLRAHNNKVFMELLRWEFLPPKYQINTRNFGCIEEIIHSHIDFKYPCVVKSSSGSKSHGVFMAHDKNDLFKNCRRVSRSRQFVSELRDFIRQHRHKHYVKESLHRNKFIVQDLIPDMKNDWKVVVFYDHYYVLKRDNRPHDFRASGSGLFSYVRQVDCLLLDAAKEILEQFRVPMISLDLAISGQSVFLFEMQFVTFGTSTLEKATHYYAYHNNGWEKLETKLSLEQEYARSIVHYLDVNSIQM